MVVNQSSMQAHAAFMGNSAHNVANVNTNPFIANRTVLNNEVQGNVQAVQSPTNGPTQLSRELTDQISVENGFDAQVRSIQTQDEMHGSLLDMRA
jgi:flagellar hook protein FlgE